MLLVCHAACVPAPRRLHQEIEILLSLLLVALGGAGWFGGASYRAIDFPLGDRKMAAKWLAVANYDSLPTWLASWNALGEIYLWDLEQCLYTKQFHAASKSLGRIAVATSSRCSFTSGRFSTNTTKCGIYVVCFLCYFSPAQEITSTSRCIQSWPSSTSRKHEHIVKLVDVVRPHGVFCFAGAPVKDRSNRWSWTIYGQIIGTWYEDMATHWC